MSFIQYKDEIKAIHKKAIAVVMSCENSAHLVGAENYAKLAINKLRSYPMRNSTERKTMENIVNNIQFILRIISRKKYNRYV